MNRGKVVHAKEEHIHYIADNIREADLLEIKALGRPDPYKAIYSSYKTSKQAWSAVIEGTPILMFGVSPVSELTGLGAPWMITTDGIIKVKKQFVKECRSHVTNMLTIYPRLSNYVDCRNEVAIRWLKWLGFTFDDAVKIGINGEWFYPFSMERE